MSEMISVNYTLMNQGYPPFVGYTYQTPAQKEDLEQIIPNNVKNIDYVAGWYYKAAIFIYGTKIKCAFVSTNSITQGEQVAQIWEPLMQDKRLVINFSYQSFVWDSEASQKAHVHCVIIGFSYGTIENKRRLFTKDNCYYVDNINAYLIEAENLFIKKRKLPIDNVPEMRKGSQPTDGGSLIISEDEKGILEKQYPELSDYIRPFLGADEYINNRKRYCLWLKNAPPSLLKRIPPVVQRISNVKDMRSKSTKAATRAWAEKPTLFTEDRQPDSDYVIVPSVSSERRRYVPIGFLNPNVVASNLVLIVPDATIYLFGVLTSNVHMAWMRTIAGRLKSDYRYSNTLVYNNFPWPEPSDEQRKKIESTAQAILDARDLYPDSSLADLYDPVLMPPELRKAHQKNDAAVMAAYGMPIKETTEASCVAWLMRLYQEKVVEMEKK